MCVCVCVCVFKGSKMNHCNRHTHHGMYGMWLFIIHDHAYTWRRSEGYHIRVLITVGPYLVGSQIIKATSSKVFAAV